MLEQIISKPTNSSVMQQESRQRQALPTFSGFADLLKANLSGRSDKTEMVQMAAQEGDKRLAGSLLANSVGMNNVGFDQPERSIMVETPADGVTPKSLTAGLFSAEGEQPAIEPQTILSQSVLGSKTKDQSDLPSAVLLKTKDQSDLPSAVLLKTKDQSELPSTVLPKTEVLNSADSFNASENLSVSLSDAERPSEFAKGVDIAGEVSETILQEEGAEQSILSVNQLSETSTAEDLNLTEDGSNRVEGTLSAEATPTNNQLTQPQQSIESSDYEEGNEEDVVLATPVIESEKMADKTPVTAAAIGGSERLGERTTEVRQESRTIKQSLNSETTLQNTMAQKGAGSDEPGQQSRGQSMQQQFMNMAQSTSQSTQVLREQQVERQFSAILNDRVATQTLNQVVNEVEAAKLNNPAVASERRGLLPVGLQSIGLPVTHQKWGQALGQRVVYMANQQLQQAQITLNPEKLGPVQVRLQIDHDQKVNVVMTAQHSVTREAMETAMPRLREMLEQAGVDVASVDVNDQKQFAESEKETSKNQQASSANSAGDEETDGALTGDDSGVTTYSTDNIVDYYA